ncbi:diaminopimelate decarboxylase [Gammaproteobacteria bacterium]|nr:diaminopimelate decarboxylase [Gammaproteobacteria bacterium]
MDYFAYKDNKLFCEEVDLKSICDEVGTPAYVYSKKTLERHANAYLKSFSSTNNLICFSVKSLSNLSVLNVLKKIGCGFDIVSGGELHRVLAIKADPNKIIFSGVGKSEEEIEYGIRNRILSFNIESGSELKRIESVASKLNINASISIRFNPEVDSGGHDYITTGRKGDKFGISSLKEVMQIAEYANKSKNINLVGLACHIGSQILNLESYKAAAEKTVELADKINALGVELKFLDMGGGLGVPYNGETPPNPADLVKTIEGVMSNRRENIVLEPGRTISANAGTLLTSVEYIKDDFLIVDSAMNDLLRPSLYGAEHDVWNINNNQNTSAKNWNVVGPICESSDFIRKNIALSADEGDVLAVKTAGAYGFVMSSNYNSRRRCAEVLVDGSKFEVVKRRESYADLLNLEEVPND